MWITKVKFCGNIPLMKMSQLGRYSANDILLTDLCNTMTLINVE